MMDLLTRLGKAFRSRRASTVFSINNFNHVVTVSLTQCSCVTVNHALGVKQLRLFLRSPDWQNLKQQCTEVHDFSHIITVSSAFLVSCCHVRMQSATSEPTLTAEPAPYMGLL